MHEGCESGSNESPRKAEGERHMLKITLASLGWMIKEQSLQHLMSSFVVIASLPANCGRISQKSRHVLLSVGNNPKKLERSEMDDKDRRILAELQKDAGQSIEDLATKVHLSRNACWRRIKVLEDQGIIRARVAPARSREV